jgi:hypothetical protein
MLISTFVFILYILLLCRWPNLRYWLMSKISCTWKPKAGFFIWWGGT